MSAAGHHFADDFVSPQRGKMNRRSRAFGIKFLSRLSRGGVERDFHLIQRRGAVLKTRENTGKKNIALHHFRAVSYTHLERLNSLPGVLSATYSSDTLVSGSLWSEGVRIEGRNDKGSVDVDMLKVGPAFFQTLHIPSLAGRTFTAVDFGTDKSAAVAVVNRAFVRRFAGDRNPLGLHFGGTNPNDIQYEIVGVVGDTKYQDLRTDIEPTGFIPLQSKDAASFEVRTAGNPSSLIPTVRPVSYTHLWIATCVC